MKRYLFVFILTTISLFAQGTKINKNTWQIGFTLGEIPILSGSFKPGLTFGYSFNDQFLIDFTYQFKDYLQRDEESFNAINIGYDGLVSSKETTGERIFLGLRYKPIKWSPYLTAGFVINNDDVETIKYDNRNRVLGETSHDGTVTIMETRESGFSPAIGFGYQYNFNNNISVNTNFAMSFFTDISTPKIYIETENELSKVDLEMIKKEIEETYKSNFHNRYHIFNLGVIYRFN